MPFYTKSCSTNGRFLMAAFLVGQTSEQRDQWPWPCACALSVPGAARKAGVKMGVDKGDEPALGTHLVHQKFKLPGTHWHLEEEDTRRK